MHRARIQKSSCCLHSCFKHGFLLRVPLGLLLGLLVGFSDGIPGGIPSGVSDGNPSGIPGGVPGGKDFSPCTLPSTARVLSLPEPQVPPGLTRDHDRADVGAPQQLDHRGRLWLQDVLHHQEPQEIQATLHGVPGGRQGAFHHLQHQHRGSRGRNS